MKNIQVFCVVFSFMAFTSLVFPVTSLKCFKCNSGKNWNDCQEEEFECPRENNDRCVKVYYETPAIKTFTKFCEKEDQCTNETSPWCKAATSHGALCELHCCEGDLCNAGSASRISVILLTCAVLVADFLQLK